MALVLQQLRLLRDLSHGSGAHEPSLSEQKPPAAPGAPARLTGTLAVRGNVTRRTPPKRRWAAMASANAGTKRALVQRLEPLLPPHAEDPECVRPPIDPRLDPADQRVPEQDRQHVVAPAPLRRRDVDLPDVVEVVQRRRKSRSQMSGSSGARNATPGSRRPARRRRDFGLGGRQHRQVARDDESSPADALDLDRDELSRLDELAAPRAARPRRQAAVGRTSYPARRRPIHSSPSRSSRADRGRDSATAACGGTGHAPRGARRAAPPETAARRGRRRCGCRRGERGRGCRTRPAPRGSRGPGSWDASTSRSPPAARRRSRPAGHSSGSARAAPPRVARVRRTHPPRGAPAAGPT